MALVRERGDSAPPNRAVRPSSPSAIQTSAVTSLGQRIQARNNEGRSLIDFRRCPSATKLSPGGAEPVDPLDRSQQGMLRTGCLPSFAAALFSGDRRGSTSVLPNTDKENTKPSLGKEHVDPLDRSLQGLRTGCLTSVTAALQRRSSSVRTSGTENSRPDASTHLVRQTTGKTAKHDTVPAGDVVLVNNMRSRLGQLVPKIIRQPPLVVLVLGLVFYFAVLLMFAVSATKLDFA